MKLQTMPLRFRVWCVSKGDFITLQDVFFPQEIRKDKRNETELNLRWFCRFIAKETSMMALDNDEYIISQDTGLKDKNGKSIYIGDVCFYAPYERYVPVFYKDGIVVIKIREWEEYYASQHLDELEVVGNIWKNQELLEENNEKWIKCAATLMRAAAEAKPNSNGVIKIDYED